MRAVVINAICAFVMMIIQSCFHSSFGVEIFVNYAMIAAVLTCALAMPVASGAISVLILGLLCDLMASGPDGFFALTLSVVYVVIFVAMERFRTTRVIGMMIYGALAAVLFDAILALGYCIIYHSLRFGELFMRHALWDGVLTGICTPLMMYLVKFLERVFRRRKTSGLA